MEDDHDIKKLSSFLAKLKCLENFSCWSSKNQLDSKNQHLIQNSLMPSEKEKRKENLQKCLQENEKCYLLLSSLECCLNLLLEHCMKEQKILNVYIDMCLHKQLKNSCGKKAYSIRKVSCMPYFKDSNGFFQPHNEDVSRRQIQGHLNQYDICVPQPWHQHEKNIVESYIKKVEKEKWTQTLIACGMLHMKNVEQMSLEELVEMRYDEYDWLKISVTILKNTHTPDECRALWFNCLHPQLNQENWTEWEIEKLEILVKQYVFQDWERIAQELGTKRSSFQCICQFNMQIKQKNESEWHEDEITLLQKYVKMFCCRDFIPWHKIKRYIDGRDLNEIFKVWNSLNNKGKKGTFSLEEDIVLVAGMKYFGSDYSRIGEYIPDRSARQVRMRVEVLKSRQFPKRAWSTEEDKLLKALANKYGFGNWLKISMHFVNRSSSAVRWRIKTLQKNKYDESCSSLIVRNPMRRTDPVNINVLWEAVQDISLKNESRRSNSNIKIPFTPSISEISRILELKTFSKNVKKRKLKAITNKQYRKFFEAALFPDERQCKEKHQSYIRKTKIHSLAYETMLVLKLMEGKINLPVTEILDEDKTISEHDKLLVKYFIHEIMSTNDMPCEIFPSPKLHKFDLGSSKKNVKSDGLMFPPNLSTLIAVRSLFLNKENLKEQGQGLTMQVNNIDLKQMNSICCPKQLHYSENYFTASELWNERLQKLLGSVPILLNKECTVLQSLGSC